MLADLRAAAVDDTGLMPTYFSSTMSCGEAALQRLVDHGVAAVLDDEGLAGEAPDVGQGLEQDLGFARSAFCIARVS